MWLSLRSAFFDRFWALALLNTFAFYLFLPIFILLPFAIWQRKRRLMVGLVFSVLLFGVLCPPRLNFFANVVPTEPTEPTLKVMTFNLLWSNQNYPKIAQMIREVQPDLIGVQELQPKELPNLLKALGPEYSYHAIHPVDRFHTVALLSRLPIASVTTLSDPPLERGLQTTVVYGPQRLNVLVTHLVPNNMPIEGFVAATLDRYRRRAAETAELRKILRKPLLPTLMLCDCNLTETSEAYQQLRQVLKDSFQERGQGLGHTIFASGIPFPIQRIDYVWHTDEFKPVAAFVGTDGGSDHLPMIATFTLR